MRASLCTQLCSSTASWSSFKVVSFASDPRDVVESANKIDAIYDRDARLQELIAAWAPLPRTAIPHTEALRRAYVYRARALRLMNRRKEALDHLETAKNLIGSENDAILACEAGILHIQLKQWGLARREFTRTLELTNTGDDLYIQALVDRSGVLYELGDTVAALADANEALCYDPDCVTALLNRSRFLARSDTKAALKTVQHLLTLRLDRRQKAEAHFRAGALLSELGELEPALKHYDEVEKYDHHHAGVRVTRQDLLRRIVAKRNAEEASASQREEHLKRRDAEMADTLAKLEEEARRELREDREKGVQETLEKVTASQESSPSVSATIARIDALVDGKEGAPMSRRDAMVKLMTDQLVSTMESQTDSVVRELRAITEKAGFDMRKQPTVPRDELEKMAGNIVDQMGDIFQGSSDASAWQETADNMFGNSVSQEMPSMDKLEGEFSRIQSKLMESNMPPPVNIDPLAKTRRKSKRPDE